MQNIFQIHIYFIRYAQMLDENGEDQNSRFERFDSMKWRIICIVHVDFMYYQPCL